MWFNLKIEQKGIVFDHDFANSFFFFSSLFFGSGGEKNNQSRGKKTMLSRPNLKKFKKNK